MIEDPTSTTNHYHHNDNDNEKQEQQQQHNRTISHFDLVDAFYVACERELNPSLIGVPVAVSQYNPHGTLVQTDALDIETRLVAYPGKVEKDQVEEERELECVSGGGKGGGNVVPSVTLTHARSMEKVESFSPKYYGQGVLIPICSCNIVLT